MNRTVVVCGVARSGTSMACGILSRLGVHIPTNKPTKHQLRFNPYGMQEHIDFLGFSVAINNDIKIRLDKNIKTDFDFVARKHKEAISKVVKKHSKDLWGFKAYSIYSLDILARVLENPHFIFVTRDVIDHAKAFQVFRKETDNGTVTPLDELRKELVHNHMVLCRSLERVEDRDIPCILITYRDLKYNPIEITQKIVGTLKIRFTDKMRKDIKKFINPRIRTWKEVKGKLIFNDTSEFRL